MSGEAFQDKKVNHNPNGRLKGGLNADRPVMISELADILNDITDLSNYLKKDGTTVMTGLLVLSGDPLNALNPVTKQLLETTITALINGAPSDLNTLKELADAINNDPTFSTTILTELANIKNYEFKVLYYESINTPSGTITKPTNTDIILSDFPQGYDAVVETIINGEPSGQIARTAGGVPITVTSLDLSGNYILSGTPSATPIAFLYILKVKAQYMSNLTFDNIIETANFSLTSASDLPFTPNGDISAINVQDAIVEVRDDTDIKLTGKQPIDSDLTTIAGLTPTNDDIIQRKAGAWTNRTPAQYKVDLVLVKGDVGLGNVDNTSDATKNSAVATLTNKTLTSPVINSPTGIVKGDVGLGNVDNTSDVNKPVSTAQAAANAVVLSSAATDATTKANTAETNAKSYADGLVVGLWDDRGSFDASVNAYPSSGGSGSAGAIKKGDTWTISVAGTLPTAQVVEIGDVVRAISDTPGNTQANWAIQQNNIGYTAENTANKSTDVSADQTSNVKYSTPKSIYDWATGLFATITNLALKADKVSITGATKTKITYNTQGIVTSGADATTADIADSTDKRYQTDNQNTYNDATSSIQTQLNNTITQQQILNINALGL